MDDLALLGWYLIRPVFRTVHRLRPELLPDVIISGAECFTDIHPTMTDDMWGAEEEQWHDIEHRSLNILDTCFLRSPADAAAVNERWFEGRYGIYGLALPCALIPFLAQKAGEHFNGNTPVTIAALPLTKNEPVLGYDILAYSYRWGTFLCNYLEQTLYDDFNERLNSNGLVASREVAERFSVYLNEHKLGEPYYHWMPCAIVRPAEACYREDKPPVPCRFG